MLVDGWNKKGFLQRHKEQLANYKRPAAVAAAAAAARAGGAGEEQEDEEELFSSSVRTRMAGQQAGQSLGSVGHPELCHRPCVHLLYGRCAEGH